MKNKVAYYRKLKKMSQKELSEKSGISRTYISDIERGVQTIYSNEVMIKLSKALDEPVELIFFNSGVV